MSELSRFFSIIIHMYAEAGAQHNLPHFHAVYNKKEAVYVIRGKEILKIKGGDLGTSQERKVRVWARKHKDEIQNSWNHLIDGTWDKTMKIDPLQ